MAEDIGIPSLADLLAELDVPTDTEQYSDEAEGRCDDPFIAEPTKDEVENDDGDLHDVILQPGIAVMVQGHTSLKHLNDKTGICDEYDRARDRWSVFLETGECRKIKPSNLIVIGRGEASLPLLRTSDSVSPLAGQSEDEQAVGTCRQTNDRVLDSELPGPHYHCDDYADMELLRHLEGCSTEQGNGYDASGDIDFDLLALEQREEELTTSAPGVETPSPDPDLLIPCGESVTVERLKPRRRGAFSAVACTLASETTTASSSAACAESSSREATRTRGNHGRRRGNGSDSEKRVGSEGYIKFEDGVFVHSNEGAADGGGEEVGGACAHGDSAGCDGREMWRVVHSKLVAVNSEPVVGSKYLGARRPGARVAASSRDGNWLRLHPEEGFGARPAWMLIDGAELGLGPLLQPDAGIALQLAIESNPVAKLSREEVFVTLHSLSSAEVVDVRVPKDAKIFELRTSIVEHIGRSEIMTTKLLKRRSEPSGFQTWKTDDPSYVSMRDGDDLGLTRHVFVMRADVTPMQGSPADQANRAKFPAHVFLMPQARVAIPIRPWEEMENR